MPEVTGDTWAFTVSGLWSLVNCGRQAVASGNKWRGNLGMLGLQGCLGYLEGKGERESAVLGPQRVSQNVGICGESGSSSTLRGKSLESGVMWGSRRRPEIVTGCSECAGILQSNSRLQGYREGLWGSTRVAATVGGRGR